MSRRRKRREATPTPERNGRAYWTMTSTQNCQHLCVGQRSWPSSSLRAFQLLGVLTPVSMSARNPSRISVGNAQELLSEVVHDASAASSLTLKLSHDEIASATDRDYGALCLRHIHGFNQAQLSLLLRWGSRNKSPRVSLMTARNIIESPLTAAANRLNNSSSVSLGCWSRRRCNNSCASLSLSICSLRVLNSSLDVAPGRAEGLKRGVNLTC